MLKRGFKQMLAEANAAIETLSVADAIKLVDDPKVALIDIRDKAEVQQTGGIKGATHASRGLLEFHADPDSPMYNPAFDQNKKLVLYCASGGRSALAAKTLKDMGYTNVAHVAGGFNAWTQAGGPTEKKS
ncbi:MAG: rhodanese-like domain-containing protein [Gammaproteobacteria bacterium]